MSGAATPGLVVPFDLDDAAFKRKLQENGRLIDDGFGKFVSKAQATASRIDAEFGKVTLGSFKIALAQTAALQDKLTAATVKGERDVVTALNAELAVRRKVEAAAVAQLQTQLAVANATGSRRQAQELEEVLGLQQRIRALNSSGVTGTGALGQAEHAGAALAHAEAPSLGRAATRLFDSTRLATLEEGGARLRLFGSALEPLGAYGLAAAAGVIALGEALAQTHEAIEYADGLYRAAKAAHTTTDELQIMREALQKAGGQAQEADGALLSFSETFGKAQAGLKRDQRGFAALGLNVNDFKDAPAALDAVVAKIQKLRPSDQDAALDLLGLKGLGPLILSGAEAWKTYREEAAKAVLPADVIKRGHELNQQVDELNRKIKNEMTQAFIDLGPILITLLGLLAKMAGFAKDVADGIGNHKTPKQQADTLQEWVNSMSDKSGHTLGLTSQKSIDEAKAKIVALRAIPEQKAAGEPPPGTDRLKHIGPKAPDHTDEIDKAAWDAFNTGLKDLASAQAELIEGIHARLDAENDAVDADLAKKLKDLDDQAAKVTKDTTDTNKALHLALISQAKLAEEDAAETKKLTNARKAATAALDEVIQTRDFIRGQQSKITGNAEHMALTRQDRNALQTQELRAQQTNELNDFDARAADRLKNTSKVVPEGEVESDYDRLKRNLGSQHNALVAGQASDQLRLAFDQAGPIEQYARSVQDLNTAIQDDAVTAFKDLTSGLVDAALHARNAGDIIRNVFLNLAQQILTQVLQKEAVGGLTSLLHFIPGFADGTPGAPGGLALVGERGPELVDLPMGAKVYDSFRTMRALSTMSMPQASPRVMLVQPFQPDLRGAVMTDDLLRQMQWMASHAGQMAYSRSLSDGAAALPGRERTAQLLDH